MGYSAVAIAERVGHESIEITYRYAHLFPTIQNEMADKLNEEKVKKIVCRNQIVFENDWQKRNRKLTSSKRKRKQKTGERNDSFKRKEINASTIKSKEWIKSTNLKIVKSISL